MGPRVLSTFLALALGAQLLAELQCSQLTFASTGKGLSCNSCLQYAYGTVAKAGSGSGALCLYTCSTHSYNVDDTSVTIYVGASYGITCYSVGPTTSSVSWTFQSSRDDWNDAGGSRAEVYMAVPCWSCAVKHVTVYWSDLCPSCNDY